MKVAIIGAGLGGLLSAAILSEEGNSVDIYDRLPFSGGRFTNIPYKGFQLSTGALHMIPHGNRGPLGKILKQVGSKVEIEDSKPEGLALWEGELKTVRRKDFPRGSRNKMIKWYLLHKIFRRDRTLDKFEEGIDTFTANFLRSFLGWSLSITPSDIKFSKFLSIVKNVEKFGGPGIPIGGCKAIIDSLTEIIKSNDGTVNLRKKVEGIFFSNDIVEGIKLKEKLKYDLILSNIGHDLTARILGDEEYIRRASKLQPSSGVKFSIALEEPFIGNTGVLFTPELKRISGLNEVTNADPNLAPGGKHLLMAHQAVLTSNLKYEINLGLSDLKELLKNYKYEVIAIQSYSNGWPVNRIKAGNDIGYRTPYKNLYIVGDGAKGDCIEVDGIAAGIRNLMRDLV